MERVVKRLIELNKTISTMESCTGGAIASAITNIPDASHVIKFSAVTYSNEFKIKMGVSSELIDKYSVYKFSILRLSPFKTLCAVKSVFSDVFCRA